MALIDELAPETWGQQFRRMRERAGLSQNAAAEEISTVHLTTGTTLGRLEDREDAPTHRNQRVMAYLACLLYNHNPALLHLNEDDCPPLIRKAALKSFTDLRRRRSSCTYVLAGQCA